MSTGPGAMVRGLGLVRRQAVLGELVAPAARGHEGLPRWGRVLADEQHGRPAAPAHLGEPGLQQPAADALAPVGRVDHAGRLGVAQPIEAEEADQPAVRIVQEVLGRLARAGPDHVEVELEFQPLGRVADGGERFDLADWRCSGWRQGMSPCSAGWVMRLLLGPLAGPDGAARAGLK